MGDTSVRRPATVVGRHELVGGARPWSWPSSRERPGRETEDAPDEPRHGASSPVLGSGAARRAEARTDGTLRTGVRRSFRPNGSRRRLLGGGGDGRERRSGRDGRRRRKNRKSVCHEPRAPARAERAGSGARAREGSEHAGSTEPSRGGASLARSGHERSSGGPDRSRSQAARERRRYRPPERLPARRGGRPRGRPTWSGRKAGTRPTERADRGARAPDATSAPRPTSRVGRGRAGRVSARPGRGRTRSGPGADGRTTSARERRVSGVEERRTAERRRESRADAQSRRSPRPGDGEGDIGRSTGFAGDSGAVATPVSSRPQTEGTAGGQGPR